MEAGGEGDAKRARLAIQSAGAAVSPPRGGGAGGALVAAARLLAGDSMGLVAVGQRVRLHCGGTPVPRFPSGCRMCACFQARLGAQQAGRAGVPTRVACAPLPDVRLDLPCAGELDVPALAASGACVMSGEPG